MRINRQIIHPFSDVLGIKLVYTAVGGIRTINMVQRRVGFDSVGPIDGRTKKNGRIIRWMRTGVLPDVPTDIRPINRATG